MPIHADHQGKAPAVLVVFSDPNTRALLASHARGMGFEAIEAAAAAAAAESLRLFGGETAFAVIDLNLPGAGGLAAARELRGLLPGLPCCLVAGGAHLAAQAMDTARWLLR